MEKNLVRMHRLVKKCPLINNSNISDDDIKLLHVVDSCQDVMDIINNHYKNENYSPNF